MLFEGEYRVGALAAIDKVLGRITDLEGTPYRGEHPIILVSTPHGSVVRVGRCYVRLELTEAELAQLEEFERLVPRCQLLYGGKLDEQPGV